MARSKYILPALEMFVDQGLDIAYCASIEPQILTISIKSPRKSDLLNAPGSIRYGVDVINEGFAGGSDFPPWSGAAKLLSGPRVPTDPGAAGPNYQWELEVSGMCPLFLRYFVERLSAVGTKIAPTRMSIHGSRPPDGSAMSVTDVSMRGWLVDHFARPKAWSDPGFEIHDNWKLPRGASVRIVLAGPTSKALQASFLETVSSWAFLLHGYADSTGKKLGSGDIMPRVAMSKTELTARFTFFDFIQQPARDQLVNGLARFHREVAPIREAYIAP